MATKHGKCGSPEYLSWGGMLNRCENSSQRSHETLVSNGVTVCEAWRTFPGFYADMGSKPDTEHVLTRLDPDGDFCPENCIWAPYGVNQHNDKLRSNNTSGVKGVFLTSRGKFAAAIYVEAKKIHLGTFDTIGEAATARSDAEALYWYSGREIGSD